MSLMVCVLPAGCLMTRPSVMHRSSFIALTRLAFRGTWNGEQLAGLLTVCVESGICYKHQTLGCWRVLDFTHYHPNDSLLNPSPEQQLSNHSGFVKLRTSSCAEVLSAEL